MVKWLRRRPLTAEPGVRVPLGVPYKTSKYWMFLFFPRVLERLFQSLSMLDSIRTPEYREGRVSDRTIDYIKHICQKYKYVLKYN